MGIIYKAKNKIDGKVYIGQTVNSLERRRSHHFSDARMGSDLYFHRAIRKYGQENFEWTIIDEHENENVLNQLERLHISRYESNDSLWGYNLTEGGEGVGKGENHPFYGKHLSKEARQKIRVAVTGNKNGMKQSSESHKGKKLSKEQKIKISRSMRGKGLFGYTGGRYKSKKINPWKRVWSLDFHYNKNSKFLGVFNDPLSWEEIYGEKP